MFAFNDEGNVETETFSNGFSNSISYSDTSTVITGSNGLTTTYNSNAFGEITEYLLSLNGNDKSYTYSYDGKGNIKTISHSISTLSNRVTCFMKSQLKKLRRERMMLKAIQKKYSEDNQ